MKKLIVSACAVVASAMALASVVESSNTFGILKVDTGNTDSSARKQYVVSVPWTDVGSANAVKACDLVLASKLNAGDLLYVYGSTEATGKDFGSWTVLNGAWSPVTVSVDNTTSYEPTDAGVARGIAIVVETAANAIYLSGQYAGTAATVTIKAATATSPSYTLIGGSLAKNIDLNNDVTFNGTVGATDEIRLSATESYRYKDSKWEKKSGTKQVTVGNETRDMPIWSSEGVTLPIGKGAWYIRRSTEPLTLTFKADN